MCFLQLTASTLHAIQAFLQHGPTPNRSLLQGAPPVAYPVDRIDEPRSINARLVPDRALVPYRAIVCSSFRFAPLVLNLIISRTPSCTWRLFP